MDGNKCNDRGYHEFRNLGCSSSKLRNIKCKDCRMDGADYLGWGWVHPV